MSSGPTFIGIGAQKAATTWLHVTLSAHPDVFVSDPKELDFFTDRYNRGFEWYERHFIAAEAAVRGETSPSYLFDVEAPVRACNYDPSLRIVAILRDPVNRAFSNHLHVVRKGYVSASVVFEEAEPRNPMYLEQGRYATHLSRWFDAFGKDAVLVLLAEEIAAEPETAIEAVYRHLGLPPGFRPLGLRERYHESVGARFETVQRLLKAGGDGLRRFGLSETVERIKGAGFVRSTLALNKRDLRAEIPKMIPATRLRLEQYFAEETLRLATMLGRTELPWPTWRAAASQNEFEGKLLS